MIRLFRSGEELSASSSVQHDWWITQDYGDGSMLHRRATETEIALWEQFNGDLVNCELIQEARFEVDIDEVDGRKFWRGGCEGDKGETQFDYGQPMILYPEEFDVGYIVIGYEPCSTPR